MSPNPFWDFSLRVYAERGVAPACIALQDELGLDVNLLLFCLWYGVCGPGRIPEETLRRCLDETRPWQQRVVQPLRELRRSLKTDPAGAPAALLEPFRRQLGEIELAAERLEQDLLAGPVPGRGAGSAGTDRALPDACANVATYLRVLDLRITDADRRHLQVILAATLAGTAREEISRALAAALTAA